MLLLPSPRILHSELMVFTMGVIVLLAGQILRALTIGLDYIVRGGRKGQIYAEGLVTSGLFAHCRNPLYLSNILFAVGLTLTANSLIFLLIGVPILIFSYYSIVVAEELYLMKKYRHQYAAYCYYTPRFTIAFKGLLRTITRHNFHWRRLLVKEYNTAYAWTGGLVLLLLLRSFNDPGHFTAGLRNSLYILGACLTLLYLLARYLKKSGRVKGD